jgi:hypothetical protein
MVWRYTYERDVRFKVGDEKIIPRSTVKEVYASIEADLIYASENLAALPSQREEQQKAALALLGRRIYIKTTLPRQQLL